MTPPTPAETAALTDTLTVDSVQAHLWRYENDAAHAVAVACMRHWLDTHRSPPSPAQDAVDARRYRWLRDQRRWLHSCPPMRAISFSWQNYMEDGVILDAAIDAQLAALALANQEKV